MSLTWGQIKTWTSSGLSSYAGVLATKRALIETQSATVSQRISSFQGQGAAANSLREQMITAKNKLDDVAEELGQIRSAVTGAASSVGTVEAAVKVTLATAAAMQCSISPIGKSTCHIPPSPYTEAYRRMAETTVDLLVKKAVMLATTADSTFSAALRSAGMPGLAKTAASSKSSKTHDLSPTEQARFKNMTPEERAKYWSEQSEDQKRHLCDRYPEMIGNADGVEAWARDRSNRLNLGKKMETARGEVDKYREQYENAWPWEKSAIKEKLDHAREALASYEKIDEALKNGVSLEDYQHGKKGEPISLLTLQDDGLRVKAAVAQGDVDNAKHVATFVPGISTTVDGSLHDYIRQTGNLRQAAINQGGLQAKDVATIAWLGYDAPGEASLGNAKDIASPKMAQAGSDRLAGFMNGLQASRDYGAGDAHMTLVGHSYGSTTSGMASTKVNSGVIDDLVLCGSPGMGTYNTSDINVDESHRWVSGVPRGDSVQGMGSVLPGSKIGFGHLGKNPLDEDSSFTHLSSDATGSPLYDPTAPASKPHNFNFDNHSIYLENGTETLQDFGRVVAGVK